MKRRKNNLEKGLTDKMQMCYSFTSNYILTFKRHLKQENKTVIFLLIVFIFYVSSTFFTFYGQRSLT